jgi:ribosomal protein L6P/L9E
MSRIGKQPIELPTSVNVSLSPGRVMVNGPLGELTQEVPARMNVEQADGVITVTRPTERGDDRALHGLTRASPRASRSGWSSRASATERPCRAPISGSTWAIRIRS